MKATVRRSAALLVFTLAMPASADVIYSGLLDTPIPTDFTGVTITLDGGTINPFFGGVGVANNNLLQPVRSGTGNLDTIQNLAVGSTIDVSSIISSGYGGSQNHVGTTFTAGQEGTIGFKISGSSGPEYGWMRVVFTGDTSGAVIKDWAYDTTASSIVVGRVNQSAASGGSQIVTVSPATGESFSLGSAVTNTGGNTNHLVKTGGGTTTLTGVNTYTGSTTISGGTLALGSGGSIDNTSGVSLGTSGTFDVSAKSGGYSVNNLTGSGNVVGAVTVTNQLANGTTPGTVNFNNLTLASLATYTYAVNGGGTTADLGNVTGTLAITSGAVLDLRQIGTYTQGDVFTLFSYQAGALSGTFKDTSGNVLADGAHFTAAGGLWEIDYDNLATGINGGTGTDNVTITAIPEPHAALLGGAGLLLLFRRRRPAGLR